jgi:hypothetical protein
MRGPNHDNAMGRPHLAGKTNRDPLRKVVDKFTSYDGIPFERLDCGHGVPVRQDMIGPTVATRRRCALCGEKQREGVR